MKQRVGAAILAQVMLEAMSAQGLNRHAVIDRLRVSTRKRSEWFQILDRLVAGSGARSDHLARLIAAIGLDPLAVQSAVADEEGDDLHRYRLWEAWAWEPTVPGYMIERVLKGYGVKHPLPPDVSRSREAALKCARDFYRDTQRPVSLPAFRSEVAHLHIGACESLVYGGSAVPHIEAERFGLRNRDLHEPPATRLIRVK